MNLLKAWINESVSNALVTSMWTALLVNRAQYLFKSDLLSLIVYGPNISTTQCVNGGTWRHLTLGKSAIFCTPNLPRSLWQLTHLYIIPLATTLALSIQNLLWLKLFKLFLFGHRQHFLGTIVWLFLICCFASEEPKYELHYVRAWIFRICHQLVTNHHYPKNGQISTACLIYWLQFCCLSLHLQFLFLPQMNSFRPS